MNATVAVHVEGAVARPPSVLVPLIKDDLEQGREASERAGMPYYQAAGEKMLEAKSQLKQGEFGSWIKRNFNLGMSQSQYYMSLARATNSIQKPSGEEFSSLRDFRRRGLGENAPSSGYIRRDWHEGVQTNVDRAKKEAERLRDAELTRQQEREAEQKLALRLIDIGYKVLAKELHPDKGGSRDTMARLNRVRDRLKASA